MPFWVVWWNLKPSSSILSSSWLIPSSSISTLYVLLAVSHLVANISPVNKGEPLFDVGNYYYLHIAHLACFKIFLMCSHNIKSWVSSLLFSQLSVISFSKIQGKTTWDNLIYVKSFLKDLQIILQGFRVYETVLFGKKKLSND